jgi:hypothetical protein
MPQSTAVIPWLAAGYPGFMPVPTMLSRTEVDYLYWLAVSQYSGRGRICELGCFFGGSTKPLAAGLAANLAAARAKNLITYDSFIMDADTAGRFPVGISAGDSFRPVFESYLSDDLPRITIRDGWLPIALKPGDETRIYPEQEPIEILFIDAAKLWSVHDSILRIFGPHLIPSVSVIVHRDFKHYGTYWLGLHMLQLRDCFEPIHDVTGGATVSFLYKGGLETELQALLTREDIAPDTIAQAWNDVDAYWASRAESFIRLFMRLAAATHLAYVGRGREAADVLGVFLDEFAHCAARGRTDGPSDVATLRAEFADACRRVEQIPGGEAAAQLRKALPIRPSESGAWRQSRREAAIDRCRAKGFSNIALFGAGRHTAELLASGWPYGRLTVRAILDDYSRAREIGGIPVMRPAALPAGIDAIVISSEASQEPLFRAASISIATIPIFRMY